MGCAEWVEIVKEGEQMGIWGLGPKIKSGVLGQLSKHTQRPCVCGQLVIPPPSPSTTLLCSPQGPRVC